MAPKATRRVYSAEQLQRLRGASSQPKLHEAIDEHDGEDAELVKESSEHVLRGSHSFAARSWKSRASANTLRVPSNFENRSTNVSDNDRPAAPLLRQAAPVLGEIPCNNQILRPPFLGYKPGPSPTPSFRKKKIEFLVKAHGSPDHVRVTAGGRIVPREQSPLCHPRYGYSAIKSNGGLIKLAPNLSSGKANWTQATQNGFVAQDVNGRLCQIVDGTILPLHETEAGLQLYIPAPNLNITQPVSPVGAQHPLGNRVMSAHNAMPQPEGFAEPSLRSQINALELEYSKLEHDLKDVDKTEVLHGRTMGRGAKDALIAKRRELIVNLDQLRRTLKSLREQSSHSTSPPQTRTFGGKSTSPPPTRLPNFLQQRQNQAMSLNGMPMYGPYLSAAQNQPFGGGPFKFETTPSPDSSFGLHPWSMPPPTLFIPPSAFDGSMSSTPMPLQAGSLDMALPPPAQQPVANKREDSRLPQSDGASSLRDVRRVVSPVNSHALPIKAPHSVVKSSLNPMSPVYKPGTGSLPLQGLQSTTKVGMEPTESPTKTAHNVRSSSVSSLATADFFPHNTTDFSTRKYAAEAAETTDTYEDKENQDPVTPAKPVSGLTHAHPTPIAPPATPVEGIPDRSQNVSPKTRIFTEIRSRASSSQSDEWLAGYQAGLQQIASMTGFQFPKQHSGSDHHLITASETALDKHNHDQLNKITTQQPNHPRCFSATAGSIGSRPGRIFSGLFSQIDSATATEPVHAESPSTLAAAAEGGRDSPTKPLKGSPARAKFERIAESVGIKVDNLSPTKRRWKDIWGASRN
ncbi:hypothetical protein LTR62_007635 [Meristemomyces frigidus]|uniref:Uncharacterized protein n=1 Tax=Meristemomyces frigidus TaxID=1508187 RepID=A0AAN7TBF5_9PEZI|nr:hypothetical protein LTR62_007635 [Meristemomyces frigidus]